MSHRATLLIAFAVACVLAGPSVARADHLEIAADAQRRFGQAQANVSGVTCDLDAARAALNDAAARQSSAASSAAAAQSAADGSSAAAADAAARLPAAQGAARDLADQVHVKRAAFDSAKGAADAMGAEVERLRGERVAAFEGSELFKRMSDDMTAARQARDAEGDAAMEWLASTERYAELHDEVEEAEEVVRAMRATNPLDQDGLAAASGTWIESFNALNAFVEDALKADPTLAAVEQRLTVAQETHKALVAQFNRDLANDSELNRMLASLRQQQDALTAQADEINRIDQQRAAAENEAARLATCINDENARAAQARADAASYANEANSLAFEVSRLGSEVYRLCDLQAVALRDRDVAAADLRRCIEFADAERAREEFARRRVYGGGGFVHGGGGGGNAFAGGGGVVRVDSERRRQDADGGRWRGRDDRDGGGGGGGGGSHQSDPIEERRQQELLAKDKSERDRIVREAAAHRTEEARLAAMSSQDAERERERARAELIREAEQKQRASGHGGAKPVASATPAAAVTPAAVVNPHKPAGNVQRASASSDGTAKEQRTGHESVDRARREAAEREAVAAKAETERRERAAREAQARADADRAKAESSRREDGRRETERRESQSKAENERRDSEHRESAAKAESARRDNERREAAAKAETDRRENERRQASEKAENDRREGEQRREADKGRRDDDSSKRQQAEQRDRERDKSFRK